MVQRELDVPLDAVWHWTDSSSALSIIRNTKTRFSVYVGHRQAEIQDCTEISSWRHVPKKVNVADGLSRGVYPADFIDHPYFQGPAFLYEPESRWPVESAALQVPPDPNEVRREQEMVMNTNTTPSFASILFPKFHSMFRLIAAIAVFLRYREWLRQKDTTRKGPLMLDERRRAELEIFRLVQESAFAKELSLIRTGENIPKSSPLYRLRPIIVDGLLCVGGRLQNAPIGFDERHPILLPAKDHVTDLIIADAHKDSLHASPNQITNELRKRLWIVGMKTKVKSSISKCLACRRYHALASNKWLRCPRPESPCLKTRLWSPEATCSAR